MWAELERQRAADAANRIAEGTRPPFPPAPPEALPLATSIGPDVLDEARALSENRRLARQEEARRLADDLRARIDSPPDPRPLPAQGPDPSLSLRTDGAASEVAIDVDDAALEVEVVDPGTPERSDVRRSDGEVGAPATADDRKISSAPVVAEQVEGSSDTITLDESAFLAEDAPDPSASVDASPEPDRAHGAPVDEVDAIALDESAFVAVDEADPPAPSGSPPAHSPVGSESPDPVDAPAFDADLLMIERLAQAAPAESAPLPAPAAAGDGPSVAEPSSPPFELFPGEGGETPEPAPLLVDAAEAALLIDSALVEADGANVDGIGGAVLLPPDVSGASPEAPAAVAPTGEAHGGSAEELSHAAVERDPEPLPAPPASPVAPAQAVEASNFLSAEEITIDLEADAIVAEPPLDDSAEAPSFRTAAEPAAEGLEIAVVEPSDAVRPVETASTPDALAAPPKEEEKAENRDPATNEADRLRRQRLLKRAFNNLGTFQRPGATDVPENPSHETSRSSEPVSVPPQEPLGPLSPEDEKLARIIEARAKSIAAEDHFTRLGIPREATREQAKTAFFAHAKVFHPDRLPPSLAGLSTQVKDIFAALREASDLLQDDARRAAYLAQLESGIAGAPQAHESPRRQEETLTHLKHADQAFRKKDYRTAAEAYGRTFALTRKAEYLAQEAWSLFLDPGQKADPVKVKAMLTEALAINVRCDRALYALGVLSRVEKDMAVAEKYFREAVEMNPGNAEASSELRLIEIRRRKG
jgi:tetratricopeptide (TPR) repeat protein